MINQLEFNSVTEVETGFKQLTFSKPHNYIP